jgi:proteasome activator subunit 4
MSLPDIGRLAIDSDNPGPTSPHTAAPVPLVPDDIAKSEDRYLQKLAIYARSIPYPIEPNERMQHMLDFIILRITQCVDAKDYDPGLLQWDSMLT